MTTNEVSEGKAAARALAARLPGWTVWYGEHTHRFWATPRGRTQGAPLAEGATTDELEDAVRRITGAPPRQEAATREPQHNQQDTPHVGYPAMDPLPVRHPVGARD
ncbi:hypothetical protein [Sphaerisporangium sp. TRM90804]|uniref:hypothetical protein n=1 Tax=Sphaerisporangium sp. TRM90804 TaxID=3031113 RepID=UPI00244BD7D8|nr:hypothetical protein [Sphaerisporangium sp. TRM90804]MDH2426678.1 hypothetical protein [Sphaerisporangium sp. TRM90804]